MGRELIHSSNRFSGMRFLNHRFPPPNIVASFCTFKLRLLANKVLRNVLLCSTQCSATQRRSTSRHNYRSRLTQCRQRFLERPTMRKLWIPDAEVVRKTIHQEVGRSEGARYGHRLHGLLSSAREIRLGICCVIYVSVILAVLIQVS